MTDEERIEVEISIYQEEIERKWTDGGGRGESGAYPGLSPAESLFVDMWYFWQACLVNSGDIAGYFEYMDEHQSDFMTLGASGCLEAIEGLRPHFERAVADGKIKEWHDGWRSRPSDIVAAEDLVFKEDFPALLLAFAKNNLNRPDHPE